MRLAWRELTRRPRAFVAPLGILGLIALLLLYPSAVLDGIVEEASAALRHAPGDLVVYTRDANGVVIRSRIEPATRDQVAAVPGVAEVATLDVALFTGRVAGNEDPVPFALLTSDRPIGRVVPGPGQALADTSLRERAGIGEGSEVVVGPFRVPLTVVGFAEHTNLWFGGGLVVDKATWSAIQGQTQPSGASQALLVKVGRGADVERVAAAVDEATGGVTQTFTRADAVQAMPGVAQQEMTFGYIRAVTLGVALLVVGLYLSFVTLERAPLYAVLKAVGASSRQLFGALLTQVTTMSDVAVAAAALVAWGLTQAPLGLPAELHWNRVLGTAISLRTAAGAAAALSLRRVVRVDPADALG